jgi:hypothetical protein
MWHGRQGAGKQYHIVEEEGGVESVEVTLGVAESERLPNDDLATSLNEGRINIRDCKKIGGVHRRWQGVLSTSMCDHVEAEASLAD